MKKLIDNLHHKIKKINYKQFKQYFKTNILFFITFLSLLANATLLRCVTVKNYFAIKPFLADIAVLLFICSLCYLFKPKKRIIYCMIVSIIFTTICVVNSIYYTFYLSFASVSLLITSLQVVDVSDAVVKNVLQLKDFIYVFQPILVLLVHINLVKRGYYRLVEKTENNKARMLSTMTTAVCLFIVFLTTLTPLEVGRLVKQWNREFLVMKFGLCTYQINDIFKSLEPRITSAFGYDEASRKIKEYYDNKPVVTKKNKYTDYFKGKNIITIHAESIQQFTMDLEFNNQEVTPNLNRLAKEGMFFSNFYPQVGVGTSSDTEFTLNTSLLPVSSGTVFVSYWDREYITIPKLLKEQNYYSFSMHGNNGAFWNRLAMHKEMGYDKFYHKTSYQIDDQIGLGLSDKSFFRQSIPMIKDIAASHKNFYGTMIMLSNHTPFDEVDKYGEFPVSMNVTKENDKGQKEQVVAPYMEGTIMGDYFKSVHYADSAIGEFITELDEAGLLENTVIIIYGDHDARLSKKDFIRLYNYDPYTDTVLDKKDPNYVPVDYYSYELNRKVPFIIWTKDHKLKKEVTKVMGMYDVLPTIGNMFGFSSPYQLGNDIFSVDENVVVFPNGNWLTDRIYYNNQKQEYLLLKNGIITQQDIDKYTEFTEKTLEVSNDIIMYDYIRKSKESLAVLNNKKE